MAAEDVCGCVIELDAVGPDAGLRALPAEPIARLAGLALRAKRIAWLLSAPENWRHELLGIHAPRSLHNVLGWLASVSVTH